MYHQRNGQSPYPPQHQARSAPPNGGNAWHVPVSGYMPPVPPARPQPSPQRSRNAPPQSPPRKNKPPRRRKRFLWQFIKFLLVLFLLGGAAAGIYIYQVQQEVMPYASTFLDNISVDGIDLGGMTWAEGSAAVWSQANTKQSSWYVRLKNDAGSYKDITSETLGISFDPSQALAQAWAIGHEADAAKRKSIFDFQKEIQYMKNTSAAYYSIQPTADLSPIDDILRTLDRVAYKEPVDAKILSFNPDDLSQPFTFQYEQAGQRLDTLSVKQQILEMVQTFQNGEILLSPEPIAPAVTVAELQKTVSLRYRASTPIDRHSTDERNNNIRLAFSRLNGLTVPSGGKISFNKLVGRRSRENGFFQAFEYNYGELVTGWGGGVCQASTTLYLAALGSGMDIQERTNHGVPVSYTNLGQDATVSDTRGREKDLAFRNSSGGPIFITAHVVPNASNKKLLLCDVRIYGPALENTHYGIESTIVENLPAPLDPERIADKNGTYVTFEGEEKEVSKASAGSVVETYLITYVDGAEVNRKRISRDTYPNRKAKVYYGVTPLY